MKRSFHLYKWGRDKNKFSQNQTVKWLKWNEFLFFYCFFFYQNAENAELLFFPYAAMCKCLRYTTFSWLLLWFQNNVIYNINQFNSSTTKNGIRRFTKWTFSGPKNTFQYLFLFQKGSKSVIRARNSNFVSYKPNWTLFNPIFSTNPTYSFP